MAEAAILADLNMDAAHVSDLNEYLDWTARLSLLVVRSAGSLTAIGSSLREKVGEGYQTRYL